MTESLPDDTLVRMARDDSDAFAILYRRHVERVYRYLFSRLANVSDAQDLTTQTFIAVLKGLDAYEPRGTFAAWLLGIARRKLVDHYRIQQSVISIDKVQHILVGKTSPDAIASQNIRIDELHTLLDKLNPERAEAIRLRYFGELSMREIASIMHKSEGAIKMLVARGIDDLRKMTENQEVML